MAGFCVGELCNYADFCVLVALDALCANLDA